jgi:polyferredoxin
VPLALRPDPPPLETDDVKIVAGGTALWAVALVVLVVLRLAGTDVHGWWITMCAAGAALGLVGVRYCQRRRDAIARDRSG